ncbi:flagellar basal body-associated protein FliL [Ruegeria lacuscaerulensis]|uniref:flagellar basal body-associated protein FliL n=1 Tax=Ruegeria lacuscaerulensis TaxID=55218 RepID=UPI00147A185C|nr:flagellar basal body-associated protein FliL [Ruegeria lacuscaerulensis]
MMKMLIPVVFLLVGLGVGIGAGVVLSPSAEPKEALEHAKSGAKPEKAEDKSVKSKSDLAKKQDKQGEFEYLKLTKQFVIPVVTSDRIAALVTMSLSLEITPGMTEAFYAIEPKLRDGFLQVMFDHANAGGFDGAFTESDNLEVLRKALLEVARKDLGDDVSQVLIMSVSRQDT